MSDNIDLGLLAPTVEQVTDGLKITIPPQPAFLPPGTVVTICFGGGRSVQVAPVSGTETLAGASITVPLLEAITGQIYYTVRSASGEELRSPEVDLKTSGPAHVSTATPDASARRSAMGLCSLGNERVLVVEPETVLPSTIMVVNRSGKAVAQYTAGPVLEEWWVGDTNNSFYGCMDVDFSTNGPGYPWNEQ